MPTWQKVIILLVVLLYMIVNEGERIENSERIGELEKFKETNTFLQFKQHERLNSSNDRFVEHIHIYSTGKPKP